MMGESFRLVRGEAVEDTLRRLRHVQAQQRHERCLRIVGGALASVGALPFYHIKSLRETLLSTVSRLALRAANRDRAMEVY